MDNIMENSNTPAEVKIGEETYSTGLTELDLSGKGLTDDDIVNLKFMTKLIRLDISVNSIKSLTALSEQEKRQGYTILFYGTHSKGSPFGQFRRTINKCCLTLCLCVGVETALSYPH